MKNSMLYYDIFAKSVIVSNASYFNYKDIFNWKNMITTDNKESKEFRFIETIRECFYYQHITELTRKRGNGNLSLIDLILSDELMQVSEIEYHAPLGKSDQSVIIFDFHCYFDYSKTTPRHSYGKCNYSAMKNPNPNPNPI